jgi:hypothetical protein
VGDRIKEDEMGAACSVSEKDNKFMQNLCCEKERPRCRWEYNIKIDLTETGWERQDWIHRIQDRAHKRPVLSSVMNIRGS